jgi:hypothetical protein
LVDIYNNAGAKVAPASNIEALRDSRAVFGCLEECVGILNSTGNIHIVNTVGEVVRRVPVP